jgi:hypothetical protein
LRAGSEHVVRKLEHRLALSCADEAAHEATGTEALVFVFDVGLDTDSARRRIDASEHHRDGALDGAVFALDGDLCAGFDQGRIVLAERAAQLQAREIDDLEQRCAGSDDTADPVGRACHAPLERSDQPMIAEGDLAQGHLGASGVELGGGERLLLRALHAVRFGERAALNHRCGPSFLIGRERERCFGGAGLSLGGLELSGNFSGIERREGLSCFHRVADAHRNVREASRRLEAELRGARGRERAVDFDAGHPVGSLRDDHSDLRHRADLVRGPRCVGGALFLERFLLRRGSVNADARPSGHSSHEKHSQDDADERRAWRGGRR